MRAPNAIGRQYLDSRILPDRTMLTRHTWICAVCPPAQILEEDGGGKIRVALRGAWKETSSEAIADLDAHNHEKHGRREP